MKTVFELQNEYAEFQWKAMKASKEFSDAYNKLSPENKMRFQKELISALLFQAARHQ